jgi:glyoxylase-like metal-dependent hydrolase (beta-lactamase superfamily II)
MHVKEVAEKIFRLEVPIPIMNSVFGVYLIKEGEGILIEPGPSIAVPYIQEGMNELRMHDLAYIIPTHMHVDHAGSIGTLANLFPQAKVLVHPQGAKHALDPSRLIESTRMVWGVDFEANLGPILPVPKAQIRVPENNEVIHVNGRELNILYAPGHAPHQMVIFDRNVKGIFCGDALGLLAQSANPFPLPNTAPPGFDQELYLQTVQKLRVLQPRVLFYSHGGVVREPDGLISMVAENTLTFGSMVLRALKEGKAVEEIIQIIRGYIEGHFGVQILESDLTMFVSGYVFYFQKRGMV